MEKQKKKGILTFSLVVIGMMRFELCVPYPIINIETSMIVPWLPAKHVPEKIDSSEARVSSELKIRALGKKKNVFFQ